MNKSSASFVWDLKKLKEAKAECTICQKVLKCVGGSTKGLQYHLQKVHNFDSKRPTTEQNEGTYLKYICYYPH